MKLPKNSLQNAALVALATLISGTAHAGEVLIRAAGKVFRAEIPATESEMKALSESQILDLLKGAEIKDVSVAPTELAWTESYDHVTGGTPIDSWTEPNETNETKLK